MMKNLHVMTYYIKKFISDGNNTSKKKKKKVEDQVKIVMIALIQCFSFTEDDLVHEVKIF